MFFMIKLYISKKDKIDKYMETNTICIPPLILATISLENLQQAIGNFLEGNHNSMYMR